MKPQEKDLDFDFGFSFVDDKADELQQAKIKIAETSGRSTVYQLRLEELFDAVIPFLDNLCKNPEKSTIHWPNRVEKIEAYKEKLKQIVEGKE